MGFYVGDYEIRYKQEIINTVKDLIINFLYYDRKEDEDLPVGIIEQAIDNNIITIDEIVDVFKEQLKKKVV